MAKEHIARKTHYEAVIPYLEHAGYSVDELTRQSKIFYPDEITFLEFQALMQRIYPSLKEIDQSNFVYYSNVFFHLCQMQRNEHKIYYVMPQLAAKLADTSLNVDIRCLKAPYPELYIQVDKNLFQIIDVHKKTAVSVEGIYVYFKEREDGIKEIRIMAAALLEPTLEIPFNDSVFFFKFELGEGKIQDLIQDYVENQINFNMEELKKAQGDINLKYIYELANFTFNVLLYITSADPDVIRRMPRDYIAEMEKKKSGKKIRKLMQRMEKAAGLSYILVGSKIVDNEKNVDSIYKAGNVVKWKLQNRSYVPGHWRLQWYGSEKDNTKTSKHIFIAPFYRGPELADVIHKKYQVGKQ